MAQQIKNKQRQRREREQRERERRHRRRERRRKERERIRQSCTKQEGQPWLQVEYYLCLIATLIVLAMGVNMFSTVWYYMGTEQRNEEEVKANEPEYITFIRGVIHPPEEEEVEPEEEEPPYVVNIDQFKDNTGYAGQVYALKDKYPEQVTTILSHYENAKVTVDGEDTTIGEVEQYAIPERLLQLVYNNEETISFVADYPTQYEVHHGEKVTLEDDLNSAKGVPHLLQWDERWGYENYGDGMISYTGCGPTCLAMVALYMTRDTAVTPKTIANYADSAGYYTDGVGSAWSLMGEGCVKFGIRGTEMSISKESMISHLEQGQPLICAVGKGDFTRAGHFIVISGYRNGEFLVNDPNSIIRTEQTWDYWRLANQIKNMWYYTRVEE